MGDGKAEKMGKRQWNGNGRQMRPMGFRILFLPIPITHHPLPAFIRRFKWPRRLE
jgi:hypothetical protein